MKREALDAVDAQLGRDALSEAARALLTLWRAEPYPELADALDRFPERETPEWEERATARMDRWLSLWRKDDPLWVGRLLSELDAMLGSEQARFVTPCFDALAGSAPDPRVARRAVNWALDVRAVLAPTKPLYRGLEKTVKRHVDPRTLPSLRRLADEGTPWSAEIRALSTLNGVYRVIAERAEKAVALSPLPTEVAARLRAIGERAAALPVPAEAEAGLLDVGTMLSRIREVPEDEAHRAVFRDRLLEASDPWGELIALQEARGNTSRERSLLKQLRPRILGGLALEKPSVLSELEFGRGFLVGATLKLKGVTRLAAMLSRPELSLLERVTFMRDSTLTPNLRALKEAHGITLDALAVAQKKFGPLKLEAVTVIDATLNELTTATWWPALRALHAHHLYHSVADLFLLPVAKQLIEVGLSGLSGSLAFKYLDVAELNRAPPSIERVRFVAELDSDPVTILLTRASDGWRAELSKARSLRPGHGGGDDLKLVPEIERSLQAAKGVVVLDGVPEVLRALAR